MKFLIVASLVALAAADVSHIVGKTDKDAQIVKQEQDLAPDGSYAWGFETENGIVASETGNIKVISEDQVSKVAQGESSYTAPGGEKIVLTYVADENGYQPQGDHLPTPPPTPEFILRALQYIRDHPPPVAATLQN